MKRIVMAALLLAGLSTSAHANGYGFYFEYANIFDGEFTDSDFPDVDYEEDHYGVGFAFDTNVAADRLFNYRMNVGYQHVEGDYDGFDDDGDGLSIDNAFGFGVFRNQNVRLWIGPAVRVSFDFFDDSDSWDLGIGAGPEIGLNIHTGSRVSFGLTAGYQILYSLNVPDDDDLDEVDGYEQGVLVKLTMLFRSSDDYF